jgi:hypothetical protein
MWAEVLWATFKPGLTNFPPYSPVLSNPMTSMTLEATEVHWLPSLHGASLQLSWVCPDKCGCFEIAQELHKNNSKRHSDDMKAASFFGGTGIWTQDFAQAKQVLYGLSHTSSPKATSCSQRPFEQDMEHAEDVHNFQWVNFLQWNVLGLRIFFFSFFGGTGSWT